MRLQTFTFAALLTLPVWQASAQTTQGSLEKPLSVSEADAPPGTDALAVQWMHVSVPDAGVLLAAVARPSGSGPFPVVVLLHGSHGFAREYVRLARDIADGGVIVLASCWFQGGGGAGSRFITSIDCPQAPPMPNPSSPEAMRTVDALMHVARTMSGVHAQRIGLFGHSRGGAAALNYLLELRNVHAVVLNSAAYPAKAFELVSQVNAPILMLHGMADSPEDGGAARTDIKIAREFEAKLKAAGKPVEAIYYEGGRHNGIFTDAKQYQDEMQRTRSFLLRHLGS